MSILTGIPRESTKGVGGILEAYICLLSDIATGATGFTMLSGVCSGLGTQAGVWKHFVVGKEAGSNFVSTLTGNIANASNTWEQVLTLIFKRNAVSKRNELKILAQNEIVCVISDNATSDVSGSDARVGNLYIIGLPLGKSVGGCDVTSGVVASGAQFADSNSLTVVIRAQESYSPLAISEADYALIKAGSALS